MITTSNGQTQDGGSEVSLEDPPLILYIRHTRNSQFLLVNKNNTQLQPVPIKISEECADQPVQLIITEECADQPVPLIITKECADNQVPLIIKEETADGSEPLIQRLEGGLSCLLKVADELSPSVVGRQRSQRRGNEPKRRHRRHRRSRGSNPGETVVDMEMDLVGEGTVNGTRGSGSKKSRKSRRGRCGAVY